jgi:hypothetical protein
MEAINIKAYTDNSTQVDAIKAFMKALKIKYEVSKEAKSPYNPEFVEKILASKKQIAEGKFTEVKAENLNSFMDSL